MSVEKRALKIALLTSDFLPMMGGIARMLDGLVRSTGDLFAWHVYTSVHAGPFVDSTLPYSVTRLDVKNPGERLGDGVLPVRKLNSLAAHLRAPERARSTIRNIRDTFRPDIAIFGCWDHAASYWAEACRRDGLPQVFLAHGMEITSRRGAVMRRRRAGDLRRASAVVANSAATALAVHAAGVDLGRVLVIHPGVCASEGAPLPPEELSGTLQTLGAGGVPYILSAGRFIRRKGFDLAITAFSALAAEFPRVHLVIAGEGPERPRLERLARRSNGAGRIHFPGYVVGRQRTALFQGCEFFVMANREVPGEMEGFGMVFREAARFGKAAIGGRNGGVSDAILDGTTGILVDTSTGSHALEAAMRSLLASPERTRQLGLRGAALVQERGTWERAGREYAAALNGIMQRVDPGRDISQFREHARG